MGKNYTEKSGFPSQYGGGYISPAQYLTEKLCVKIARLQKKDLPDHFWELPEWNKLFRRHVGEANKLLKQYNMNVILAALKDKLVWNMTSFCFPPFKKLLEKYKKILSEVIPTTIKFPIGDSLEDKVSDSLRPSFGKPTPFSKLRGL